jgi:hypothetical protein
MSRLFIVAAIIFVLSGTGTALSAQPTPVPNAAPDFSSMNFLMGTWHCVQSVPGRPGKRTETDTYTMAYDGWQMQDHSVSPPFDKYRTRTIVGDNWTTWDPTIKLWINQGVDNFGGYGLSTSSGWSGNSMIWNGTNPDGTVYRIVNTKLSDTKTSSKTWGNNKKGQAQRLQASGVCTKSQ